MKYKFSHWANQDVDDFSLCSFKFHAYAYKTKPSNVDDIELDSVMLHHKTRV